ncbi:MAG TPA: hypothetical protein VFU21_13890 [Kofleriaceae bacterium]|nr:hypothetical protein [Kofleriaceae bacterium]
MPALALLCAVAVIVAIRVGLEEADRDPADLGRVMPRVRLHRGAPRAVRLGRLAHAAFVALGVASLLVMLLALAAALAA